MTPQGPAFNRVRHCLNMHVPRSFLSFYSASKRKHILPPPPILFAAASPYVFLLIILYFLKENKSSWCSTICIDTLPTYTRLLVPPEQGECTLWPWYLKLSCYNMHVRWIYSMTSVTGPHLNVHRDLLIWTKRWLLSWPRGLNIIWTDQVNSRYKYNKKSHCSFLSSLFIYVSISTRENWRIVAFCTIYFVHMHAPPHIQHTADWA